MTVGRLLRFKVDSKSGLGIHITPYLRAARSPTCSRETCRLAVQQEELGPAVVHRSCFSLFLIKGSL